MIITLRLCVLYGSLKEQFLLPYTELNILVFITEVESVYCSVRPESLYKRDKFRP
jgi:hypothetical protein